MDYKVCKFGGSSVASAEQIRKVSGIVRSDPARKYVVVSAPGKHGQARTKVTDLLISLADDVIRGQKPDYSQVIERYSGIVRGLGMSEKVTACSSLRASTPINRPSAEMHRAALKATSRVASGTRR